MRAVFIGASSSSVMTARMLLKRGHEVVIIEQSKETIDALSHELDCGYLHGDGSKPAMLREAGPEHTDVLYCLTDNDQANILASLVGRSLGFKRVVTKITDPEFMHVCIELGLEDTIIPARTIGRYLAQMFEGHDPLEISAMIKDEARVFSFVAREDDERRIGDLKLPAGSRVMCLYRREKFMLPDDDASLEAGDEVVLITHSKNLEALSERWSAETKARE
jgi:trk system potassium uptake protein TrkA